MHRVEFLLYALPYIIIIMKKLLLLMGVICLWTLPMKAQQIAVSGKVTDAQTKENLHGANIFLQKLNKGTLNGKRQISSWYSVMMLS